MYGPKKQNTVRLFVGLMVATVASLLAGRSSHASVINTVDSLNWAGYAATTSGSNAFSNVSGDWTIPTVSTAGGSNSAVAFWVGLDGFNSSTVEQIGVAAQVSHKRVQYYAWYEMYPNSAYQIPMSVAPGDQISAAVTYVSTNEYQLALSDLSTGQSYSTLQSSSSGLRSSAEWITEAPSSGSQILPLADFGTVNFINSSATLDGGTPGSISAFTNTAIDLTASSGLSATTSALSNYGQDFSVSVAGGSSGGGGGSGHHGKLSTATVVPEPSALLLLCIGGTFLLGLGRRQGKRC